jgi:hypothetical protein
VSWNGSDDADGCSTSGSVSFVSSGGVHYCFKSATEGITYYLGMKGKGNVGCVGSFYTETNCSGSGAGSEWFNLAPTGSTTWMDATPQVATAGTGAHSIDIRCFDNGGGGAIDQIYLNAGSATGFGGS